MISGTGRGRQSRSQQPGSGHYNLPGRFRSRSADACRQRCEVRGA